MQWTFAGATLLNEMTNTQRFEYSIHIRDQGYYNGVDENFFTNLPFSKAPEGSSFAEEFADGYTEVEMEQNQPHRIDHDGSYKWNQQFDLSSNSSRRLPKPTASGGRPS